MNNNNMIKCIYYNLHCHFLFDKKDKSIPKKKF